MKIAIASPERNTSLPPTKTLPPLAERLAWPQARHPGKFADQIWTVERRPDQGLVASTYGMAGKTP